MYTHGRGLGGVRGACGRWAWICGDEAAVRQLSAQRFVFLKRCVWLRGSRLTSVLAAHGLAMAALAKSTLVDFERLGEKGLSSDEGVIGDAAMPMVGVSSISGASTKLGHEPMESDVVVTSAMTNCSSRSLRAVTAVPSAPGRVSMWRQSEYLPCDWVLGEVLRSARRGALVCF